MLAYLIVILIWVIVAVGIFVAVVSALNRPTAEQEQKWRLEEARIRLMEERTRQLPEQTRGITERYRATQENRINAMLNQRKKELEIDLLELKKELAERELGKNSKFEAQDWKE